MRDRREYFKVYNAERSGKPYTRKPTPRAIRQQRWRLYYKDNRERLLEEAKAKYRREHPEPFVRMSDHERLLSRRRSAIDYIRRNKEKVAAKNAEWRQNNRERERLRAVQYRKIFPEKTRDASARYATAHPEMSRIRGAKRRAFLLGAEIGNQEVIKNWDSAWRKKRSVRCYWCSGTFKPTECHTDHIHPLSKGGQHSIENLCVACSQCNNQKHSKLLVDWNKKLVQPILL